MAHPSVFVGGFLILAALALVIVGLASPYQGWWGYDKGVGDFGTLGFTLLGTHKYSGGNVLFDAGNLRYIGIAAVVVMVLGALLFLISFLGVVGSTLGKWSKRVRHAGHAALVGAAFTIIGGVLVLGWYIGKANDDGAPRPTVEYAQVCVLVSGACGLVGGFLLLYAEHEHHGYTPF